MTARKPTAHGRPATSRPAAYEWRLSTLMEEHGLRSTVELGPLLAERGVVLSDAQVYRIVHYTPDRLGLKTLSALCDIFGCTPNDLLRTYIEGEQDLHRTAGGGKRSRAKQQAAGNEPARLPENFTPVKADVRRPTKRRGR